MKNLFMYLFVGTIVVLMTGCGFNSSLYKNDPVQTDVLLSQDNYRIVKYVEGEWSALYVLGVGGLRKETVTRNAVSEMYKNAELTGNQQIINITTVTSIRFFVVAWRLRAVARGYVIEFLNENSNPMPSIAPQGAAQRVQDEKQTVSASYSVAQQGSAPHVQEPKPAEPNQTIYTVDESVYALFPGIDKEDVVEPQLMANDCYIAYLLRSNQFAAAADRDLLRSLCNEAHIEKLARKYDIALLNKYSKKHSKQLTTKYHK